MAMTINYTINFLLLFLFLKKCKEFFSYAKLKVCKTKLKINLIQERSKKREYLILQIKKIFMIVMIPMRPKLKSYTSKS